MIRPVILGAAAIVALAVGVLAVEFARDLGDRIARVDSELRAARSEIATQAQALEGLRRAPANPGAPAPQEAELRQLATRMREADERFAAIQSLLAAAEARAARAEAAAGALGPRLALVERAMNERLPPLERAAAERLPALERAVNERLATLERLLSDRIAALERRPTGGGAVSPQLAEQLAQLRDDIDAINDRLALERRR